MSHYLTTRAVPAYTFVRQCSRFLGAIHWYDRAFLEKACQLAGFRRGIQSRRDLSACEYSHPGIDQTALVDLEQISQRKGVEKMRVWHRTTRSLKDHVSIIIQQPLVILTLQIAAGSQAV